MNEPANHTVLLDRDGDTWVRFDEWTFVQSDARYRWRHISTGHIWDERRRNIVGKAHTWDAIQDHGPLEEVAPAYAVRHLRQVQEAQR